MIAILIAALTLLCTAIGIGIGYYLGKRQILIANQGHNLNLRKAVPIIDSTVKVVSRQVNPAPAYDPFYYVVVSIHNYGNLPAQELKGHWPVYSPTKMLQERDIPISIKILSATKPYEFEPHQLSPLDGLIHMRNSNISFYVDVELDYIGFSADKPKHYSAKWQYDAKNQQMIQV